LRIILIIAAVIVAAVIARVIFAGRARRGRGE
jgi:hypothetical protein